LPTITPRQWGGSQINDDPVGADPRVSAALTQRPAPSNHPFRTIFFAQQRKFWASKENEKD
jgi:hypothetical protein